MLSMVGYASKPEARPQGELPYARQQTAFAVSLSLAVLCLGAVLCTASTAESVNFAVPSGLRVEVCGVIPDGTWTVENSPYLVSCDATLPADATLTIEPGVEIRFAHETALKVEGTLIAAGTAGESITFTSERDTPNPGDWTGLDFVEGSSGSSLNWCVIEYATTAVHVYAGPDETVSPAFSNCTVRHNSLHGVLIEGFAEACDVGLAQPTITEGTIEDNGGCGIHGYGHGDPYSGCVSDAAGSVGGAVSRSVIRRNHDGGICLYSEQDRLGHGDVWTAIEANIISSNNGPGLHLDGDDPVHPRIENNLFYGNSGTGILAESLPGDGDLVVVNNTVVGNGADGVAFTKAVAQMRLANNIVVENGLCGLVCGTDEGLLTANNDLWGNDGGDYSGCPIGPTDISSDPLFFDRGEGGFHLRFGSPCIDAGTSDGAPTIDLDGVARPQGDEVDIGAHEFAYKGTFLPLILRE